MLGVVAAVLFAIAFFVNVSGTATDAVFAPMSLMLAGLTLLALHLSGYSERWTSRVARRRR